MSQLEIVRLKKALAALVFVFGLTLAQAAQQKFEAVRLMEQDYIPLANWAGVNNLDWFWLDGDKRVEATNSSTRLVFEVNSDQAEINGVRVKLSFPLIVEKEIPLIAQFDLDTAIAPLLFPHRFSEARPVRTICLDPGHGGKDSGNRVGLHFEKNYTLPLALELHGQLQKAGYNVIMTRTADEYVTLADRPALANRRGADLFVSLHFNATPSGRDEAEGPEIYCITPVGAIRAMRALKAVNSGLLPGQARRWAIVTSETACCWPIRFKSPLCNFCR